jgi:hypothetical protein
MIMMNKVRIPLESGDNPPPSAHMSVKSIIMRNDTKTYTS